MDTSRYKLEVRLDIVREERSGPEDYWRPSQERLSVGETLDLGALDFMGVMGVLGKLHGAIREIGPGPTA